MGHIIELAVFCLKQMDGHNLDWLIPAGGALQKYLDQVFLPDENQMESLIPSLAYQ